MRYAVVLVFSIAMLLAGALAHAQEGSNAGSFASLPDKLELTFPTDFGSHDAYRTEWWYVTGWLDDHGHPIGFQLTFFRTRLLVDPANTSTFAPRQLLFAHAALSDPREGKILFAERSARAGFDLAFARSGDTDVGIMDWSLKRDAQDGRLSVRMQDSRFALDLSLASEQPPLLEGDHGLSTKGPSSHDASAYYSVPQLLVSGTVVKGKKRFAVTGHAWLDHEWSSNYLDADAKGWDWVGANLADGGALMAFRMRKLDGSTLFSAATRRSADGQIVRFAQGQIDFAAKRLWRSASTGISYPIEQELRLGDSHFIVSPLMNEQEINAKGSTGTVYWEGAVTLFDAQNPARPLGQGYLELTGYGERLRLQ